LTKTEGKFLRLAKAGLPIKDDLVIDAHTHLGGYFSLYHIPFGDVKGIIEQLNRLGIVRICAFSFAGINSDYVLGNDIVAQAVKEHPDRIVGYATLNANYPHEWLSELERCVKIGLKGIKIICEFQGTTTEKTDFTSVYQYANDHHMIMINHHWGSPSFFENLAERYPDISFIIGHYSTEYAEILRRRRNIFQCTCAALMFGDIEKLLKSVDADKIVYGSDLTDLDGPFSLMPVLYAKITDEEKRKILGLNMQKILEKHAV
jgi:predicted TIM-barrel fold metal-dependent hydrolase